VPKDRATTSQDLPGEHEFQGNHAIEMQIDVSLPVLQKWLAGCK